MVYIGVDYFQVSKNKTERVLEVPMDTKTDFFGNSKNGGDKIRKGTFTGPDIIRVMDWLQDIWKFT